MINIAWTRTKLCAWGRWCRARGIGFPSSSAHERLRSGGSVFSIDGLPEDLEVIDHAVAVAPPQHKLMLVEHYTKDGTVTQKAAHLRLTRPNYYRRMGLAETSIARYLD